MKAVNASVLAAVLAAMAIAAWAAYQAGLASVEPQRVRVDTVTVKEIEKHEPDAKVGAIEAIARPSARPLKHEVAVGAAKKVVDGFCAAATELAVPRSTGNPELGAGPASAPALALGMPQYAPFSFSYRPGRLELFPYDAAGNKHRLVYRVHNPSAAVRDTLIVVQGDRFWWVGGALELGGLGAAGYGIGRNDWRAVAAGAALAAAGHLLR